MPYQHSVMRVKLYLVTSLNVVEVLGVKVESATATTTLMHLKDIPNSKQPLI